jgi:hypothetical protein
VFDQLMGANRRPAAGYDVAGMSALIRRIRQPYYPAWGDEKYRQGVRSASLNWFGVDRSEEILNETRHRQQRTSSPHLGAQPWPDAELKVWHRIGRAAGNADLLEHLVGVQRARPS